MIKSLFVFIGVFMVNTILAQGVLTGDAIKNIQFSDAGGRLLPLGQLGVEGTPYAFDKFVIGKIVFDNATEATDSNLNYSYFDHKLYFSKNKGLYLVSAVVKEFYLYGNEDQNSAMTLHFINGFPENESNSVSTFYELVGQGASYQLLRYKHKRIKESNVYGGAPVKEYVNDIDYYLYSVKEKKMISVGNILSFKSLKKALSNEIMKMDEWVLKLKINTKNEQDLVRLIEQLN